MRFARRAGIAVGIVSIALYEIFAPDLIRVFLNDAVTVGYGAQFLRIRAPATIVMFLCFIYVHFFQAVGHGGKALLLVVARWAVVNIPMLFLLNHLLGMIGIVWSQLVSDSLMAFVSLLYYQRFRRQTVLR